MVFDPVWPFRNSSLKSVARDSHGIFRPSQDKFRGDPWLDRESFGWRKPIFQTGQGFVFKNGGVYWRNFKATFHFYSFLKVDSSLIIIYIVL